MANRYTYTNTKKDSDTNVTYMESTIYPKVEANDNDFYIIATAGDRLDLLAQTYYNDPSMWWVIATANNLNDANFFVEAGTQLRMPADTSDILNNLYKINK